MERHVCFPISPTFEITALEETTANEWQIWENCTGYNNYVCMLCACYSNITVKLCIINSTQCLTSILLFN